MCQDTGFYNWRQQLAEGAVHSAHMRDCRDTPRSDDRTALRPLVKKADFYLDHFIYVDETFLWNRHLLEADLKNQWRVEGLHLKSEQIRLGSSVSHS